MGKNIVIFSDGTGQRSGISFDERRSNIYKLYRAGRCGPDSGVDPMDQVAFYDPGVGTAKPGSGIFSKIYQWLYNWICMATGWGLTENLIDCYAAIIRHWRPGDRIYLFGFSRGAYTVRLLGGVLSHCGVPTREGGKPIRRDEKSIRRIAEEGVIAVYQHTASVDIAKYERDKIGQYGSRIGKYLIAKKKGRLEQRRILAARFRTWFGSEAAGIQVEDPRKATDRADAFLKDIPKGRVIGHMEGESNAVPYFVGAFDTVSSMFHWKLIVALSVAALVMLALLSLVLSFFGICAFVTGIFPNDVIRNTCGDNGFVGNFRLIFGAALSLSGIFVAGRILYCHFRFPGRLRYGENGRIYRWWETWTVLTRMVFRDYFLSRRIQYARHAIAVDEHRDMFNIVRWEHESRDGDEEKTPDPNLRPDAEYRSGATLREMCFAGCHVDIGGGYPEDESRLSDIALEWMAREARSVGLQVDKWYFQLWPDPLSIQHDELSKWYNRWLYKRIVRSGLEEVELNPGIERRMRARSVLYFDREAEYRPEALHKHSLYKEWLPKQQSDTDRTPPRDPAPFVSRDTLRRRDERGIPS